LCPFLLGGVLGAARWLEGRGRLMSLAWSGAAMGAAVIVKPHAGILAAALGVIVVVAAARAGGVSGALAAVLTYTAAASAAPLAALIWVAAAGGLGSTTCCRSTRASGATRPGRCIAGRCGLRSRPASACR
jgi:hypothetical protein